MQDAAFGAHWTCVLGQWTHQVDLDLQRGPGLAFAQGREDGAADRGIEQRRGKACMHRADRIVVPILWQSLEHRAPFVDLGQMKAERLADRSGWGRAPAD